MLVQNFVIHSFVSKKISDVRSRVQEILYRAIELRSWTEEASHADCRRIVLSPEFYVLMIRSYFANSIQTFLCIRLNKISLIVVFNVWMKSEEVNFSKHDLCIPSYVYFLYFLWWNYFFLYSKFLGGTRELSLIGYRDTEGYDLIEVIFSAFVRMKLLG